MVRNNTQISDLLPLETERLLLRRLQMNDLEDTLEHRTDSSVCQYISQPMGRGQVVKFLMRQTSQWSGENHHKLNIAIQLKERRKVVGELMFKYWDKESGLAEIGFRMNQKFQRHGIALEATMNFMSLLFNKANINKIMAICDTENESSYRLMEKLGMHREGHFKEHVLLNDAWRDQYVYAQLRHQWKALEKLDLTEQ